MKRNQFQHSCLLAAVLSLGAWAFNIPARAQNTVSNLNAGSSHDWLKSAVVYEIYPRNFSSAGDFNGITARLDDLKDLGVSILWLMPIHPIGEKLKKGSIGSPYCVRDFYGINPAYGTTNDFRRLLEQAHKRDMRVLIDVVAGHTAWDSVLMAHPEFYQHDASGRIVAPHTNWTDVAKLDYANTDLRRYMIEMMKYWLRDIGVDGFRCDVAYTVPVDFWESARAELEKVNPQVIILAEAGAKPKLLSKAFDMDCSWNLFTSLDGIMRGVFPASFLKQAWEHTRDQFPEGSLHLRFTDSHAHPRAVVRYGLEGALAAQVLILTLDGVPLFYNGMEAGDSTESGDPALFEKMPIFWQVEGRPPLRLIYRELITLRKKSPAFFKGEVVWLDNSAPSGVISLLRRDAKDEFVVLIN